MGLVDNILTYLYQFVDECIECLSEDEMKFRNERLASEVVYAKASQEVDAWLENEGVLREAVIVERDFLVQQENDGTVLSSKEDEELKEHDDDIAFMDSEINQLRESLTRTDSARKKATRLDNECRAKRDSKDLDVRNHIMNRILWLRFIRPRNYHGGKLNGVDARRFMDQAEGIYTEIEAFLLTIPKTEHSASDQTIQDVCDKQKRLMMQLDIVFSTLRKPYGELNRNDEDKLRGAIDNVEKLWKEIGLPETPKYHGLTAHAIQQAIVVGGFGDMLEDELEKSHQDALRFRSRVSRLRSLNARACSYSLSEKTRNHPDVVVAQEKAMDKTSLKRGGRAVDSRG
jgi:hypothetical protein